MKSILQDLYYGNLEPAEQFQPVTEEYKQEQKKQIAHYEEFVKQLRKADESLYEKFIRVYNDMFLKMPYEYESAFICGFRMGVRFMVESMQEEHWR